MIQVLIVEDDKSYAELLALNLEHRGLSCKAVYSGNDAIEWLKEYKSQIIISDIRMPNGSGIDLIRWNANQPVSIPLIAISGDVLATTETKQFCEVMGVPYVSKPIDIDELIAVAEPMLYQTV